MSFLWTRWPLLCLSAALAACSGSDVKSGRVSIHPECRPLDGAWALSVRITDAATEAPVANAVASSMLSLAETDSVGWFCLREFSQAAETIQVVRSGYRQITMVERGSPGQVVRRDIQLERRARPCCDLRGQWTIAFQLDTPGENQPRPEQRSVSGAVNLGERYLAAEPGDDLDSLVRIVRGLHQVDFAPLWGGPVAQDVTTSVFGDGPDLLREVEGTVPAGDSVVITFIPRMSHGSLSLYGRIRNGTIRGRWIQNMYCCGAEGRFVMTRTGAPDSSQSATDQPAGYQRTLRRGPPELTVPAGLAPKSSWQPELAVAPDGRMWMANGGLFVADSFGGPWRRSLGAETDPVGADELRIGVEMAFPGGNDVLIGLDRRYHSDGDVPVLYRTTDGGVTWSGIRLEGLFGVNAIGAIEQSVWVMGRLRGTRSTGAFQSSDGGRTWRVMIVPEDMQDVALVHRVSGPAAYVATSPREGRPALWHTIDGGRHWRPLPTPSEQGFMQLEDYHTRIEQIATLGSALIVREHGRVFARDTREVRWRPLPGIEAIASETGGTTVFVLLDSLRPALLDSRLRVRWRSDRELTLEGGSYLKDPVLHRGVGYIAEGYGSIHQVRDGALRVLRPSPDRRTRQNVEVRVRPQP